MIENPGRYTGFGRFDLLDDTVDEDGQAAHLTAMELSYDVHDMWRSSLDAGTSTPFMSDFVSISDGEEVRIIDIANTPPEALPAAVKGLSYVTANVVSSMVETNLRVDCPIDDVRIEKLATTLYGLWDVIRYNELLSTELLERRYAGYHDEPD